ncbi:hypothetical protein mRhiFer1_008739 [Rhinolophus ferrumequinum]|uniref:Uncharacterized protein n=1 Tax=Rhinolophus ferrumequinum TaxID=59479 RepID=A0A7J7TN55_RHIFE|nr:hypothetical protein mRhiFer1_008739 [Rhinolophus ferrumequinum]
MNFTTGTHVSGIIQYLSFCDWLISLSIVFSGFIHVAAYVRIPILFQAVCIYHILFTHSFINEHLGGFNFLAIMNNAAIKIGVQNICSNRYFNCVRYIFRSRIAELHANATLNFLRSCRTVFLRGICKHFLAHGNCSQLPCLHLCPFCLCPFHFQKGPPEIQIVHITFSCLEPQ